MGKGLRIIEAIAPEPPRAMIRFTDEGAMHPTFRCACLAPLSYEPRRYGFAYRCAKHGDVAAHESVVDAIGVWGDPVLERTPNPGILDLGIARDSSLDQRNHLRLFTETFESVIFEGHERVTWVVGGGWLRESWTRRPDGSWAHEVSRARDSDEP